MEILIVIITLLAGYLLGSFNFAIIISKLIKKEDIRDFGSGNAGMTNMLRTYGKRYAALTLCGDALKGVLGALIGGVIFQSFGSDMYARVGLYLGGIGAILGHVYPIYFKFKGGKAIATAAGMAGIISWQVLLFLFILFVILVFLTKYISFGSITAALLYPVCIGIFCYLTNKQVFIEVLLAAFVGLFIVFLHRGNLQRLISGNERKLTFKKER